jgi:hypothetical protein
MGYLFSTYKKWNHCTLRIIEKRTKEFLIWAFKLSPEEKP